MKQKTFDTSTPGHDNPSTSGDGLVQDLAAKAAALAPALAIEETGDPRRRGEIKVTGDDQLFYLHIDGELWSEVEYSYERQAWCIQDCMGECLSHVEHIQDEILVNNHEYRKYVEKALERAKEMIRDGSMRTPEEARLLYEENYEENYE
jgi:hypothetical protein